MLNKRVEGRMSALDVIRIIRDDADRVVVMAEKLRASHRPADGESARLVVLGHPQIDDFVVARLHDPNDADTLAVELHAALRPIIERYAHKFLRTACDWSHEALDVIEHEAERR